MDRGHTAGRDLAEEEIAIDDERLLFLRRAALHRRKKYQLCRKPVCVSFSALRV